MTVARSLATLPSVERSSGWPWTEETLAASDPTWPRITIVTPSFGQGKFIEETIRSVLLQGYPNLQYLVIDGGSTDQTREVLERYAPFIDYWVIEPDRGQSHAINKGLERADGEIFGWLNSDDVYAPGTLQLAGDMLRDGGAVRWIAGSCRWKHDGEAGVVRASRLDIPLYEWLLASPIQQPASLWRRELFDEVGPIDDSLRYVMDQDLFIRFRLAEIAAHPVDRELAMLRLHTDSKTVVTADAFRRETIERLVPRYVDRLPAEQLGRLHSELGIKLLRSAKLSLRRRDYRQFARSLAQGLKWGSRPMVTAGLRVALSRLLGRPD